jgi:hypothetical protein
MSDADIIECLCLLTGFTPLAAGLLRLLNGIAEWFSDKGPPSDPRTALPGFYACIDLLFTK